MADQVKLRKRLEAILKLPENQACADCGKRGPRWASANLGVFMCIECSGIHRNLGVHISFVRSVNLDSWQPKQVQFMEEWGNARANAYFEANIPRDYVKPKETDPVRVVERFIRDKYEHKRFMAREVPPPMTSAPVEEDVPRRTTRPAARPAPVAAAPAPVPATVAAPAKEVNLLDFFDAPAPAPAPAAPAAPAAHTNGFDGFGASAAPPNGFGNFGAAPAASDPFAAPSPTFDASHGYPPQQPPPQQSFPSHGFPSNNFDSFGDFSSPVAPPAAPAAPKASADAILSLYNTNNAPQGGGMGGMSMMPPPQHLYGQPQQHQHHQQFQQHQHHQQFQQHQQHHQNHFQQQHHYQQHAPQGHMGAPMHQSGQHMPQQFGYPPMPPAGYGMQHQGGAPMMQGFPPQGQGHHMPYSQNGYR